MRRGLGLALLLGLLSAGCYSPSYHNGNLRCTASGQCPENYHCAADNTCWRNGSDPDVGSPRADAAGVDTAPSAETGLPGQDAATSPTDSPQDLSVRAEVAQLDLSPVTDVAPNRDTLLGPDSLVADAPTGDARDALVNDRPEAPTTDTIPDAPVPADVADVAGTDAADTTTAGVPLEQLAAEYARAVCARNFACCTQEDLRGKSLAVCERDVANLFKPAVDAITKGIASGRTIYYPERATQCLSAISAASCSDWPLNPVTQLPQICDNAIDSLVPRGGGCQSAAECVTRLCIGASSSADGVCQLKATGGQGCTWIVGQNSCEGENYCDTSSNTCAATKVEGASCSNSRECKSLTCVRVVPDAGTLSCVPAVCYSSGPLLPPACSIGGRPSAFAGGLTLLALALLLRRKSRNRRAG